MGEVLLTFGFFFYSRTGHDIIVQKSTPEKKRSSQLVFIPRPRYVRLKLLVTPDESPLTVSFTHLCFPFLLLLNEYT